MKFIGLFFMLISKAISLALISVIIFSCLYIGYKGNQPMSVPQAPKGMSYFEFIHDRVEAAKIVQPARCGWGMFLSLATIGPIYSVVYTGVALDPDGFLSKVTAPDPDIPKGVQNASWTQVPDVWWSVVERLSWTMLGKSNAGCHFRPVAYGSFTR
jgi:hypothetical protein